MVNYIQVPADTIDGVERIWPEVAEWWVELLNGTPVREIAFNESGDIIGAAPRGDDRGLLCDSSVSFTPAQWQEVDASSFENAWKECLGS